MMVNNSAVKHKPTRNKKYMLVRYGLMNEVSFFEHEQAHIPKVATRVVVKTKRGLEMGCLVGHLTCYRGGQFKFSNKQVEQYFDNSNIEFDTRSAGDFIRFATSEDIGEERHLNKITEEEKRRCKELVEELGLKMKIVNADHIFGGERIIFYFMSDARVDFRELVKKLAREYQSRIEMRQIGARDEARLLGDVESCGQQCCCQRFLRELKPVNMRMAKMQKATLDPTKISGYCGRLKCCLRYEDKAYCELKKKLPRRGAEVEAGGVRARVVDSQILTQLVVVEYEDGKREAIDVEQIKVLSTESPKKKSPKKKNQKKQEKENGSVNNKKKQVEKTKSESEDLKDGGNSQ